VKRGDVRLFRGGNPASHRGRTLEQREPALYQEAKEEGGNNGSEKKLERGDVRKTGRQKSWNLNRGLTFREIPSEKGV